MLVYRDAVRVATAAELVDELRSALRPWASPDERRRLESFLLAAELECALADAGSDASASAVSLTDALCERWLGNEVGRGPIERALARLATEDELSLPRPEGYAYYALDPRGFAELAAQHPLSGERITVVGVRSIGVSLSAVVAASMRARGASVRRTTVRPGGHPWDRRLEWNVEEGAWLEGEYIVVDEGPGLSGSTFLAVGEALVRAGVHARRVAFFGSRECQAGALKAERAEARFSAFGGWKSARGASPPEGVDWSAGLWRGLAFQHHSAWPASWVELERVKRARDRSLLKFEGLPPYDRGPLYRSQALYEAGFGPRLLERGGSFVEYELCTGRPARRTDIGDALLDRIACYLTFRTRAFEARDSDSGALEAMVRHNVREALGRELPRYYELRAAVPVVADARMQPHEWWCRADGRLLKLDGAAHGDDHLFPGPCDIAWDLASTAVEWDLDRAQHDALLRRFSRASGVDASARLPAHLVAYAAFRFGCSELALLTASDDERPRLIADRAYYRAALIRAVDALG